MRKIVISELLFIYSKMIITVLFIGVFSAPIVAQENKPVIGVLGLDNGGGVGEATIDTICNRISTLVDNSSKYLVLQRDFIPIVLEEMGFRITNGISSSIEGLAAAGLLLSADEMIGGSIVKNGDGITLELLRIRVSDRAQLAKQKITTVLGRQEFVDLELPGIVDNLISESQLVVQEKSSTRYKTHVVENSASAISDSKSKQKNSKNKRKRRAISFLTTGVVIGAAAATGAIYYFKDNSSTATEEVPLGTLPHRRLE